MRGKEGNASLYRIQAAPSELTFTPVTSTASNSTASGDGEQSQTTLNPTLVDQAIQQVRSMVNTDDLDALTKKSGNSNPISTGYRRGFTR
jgi:stress response protein SCP2